MWSQRVRFSSQNLMVLAGGSGLSIFLQIVCFFVWRSRLRALIKKVNRQCIGCFCRCSSGFSFVLLTLLVNLRGAPQEPEGAETCVKPCSCGTVSMYLFFFRCSSGLPLVFLKFRVTPWGAPQEPEEAPSSPPSSPHSMPPSLQRCSWVLWCSEALAGASDSSVVSAGASVFAGTVVLISMTLVIRTAW